MPILNVKVSAQRTPELSARIAETLLDLTTRVLGKRRDLTAVVITFVDPADWYVAGRSERFIGHDSPLRQGVRPSTGALPGPLRGRWTTSQYLASPGRTGQGRHTPGISTRSSRPSGL